MHVVSLPEESWVERWRDVEGLEVVCWDLAGPPPRDDLEYVVLHQPMHGDPWAEMTRLPSLRWVQALSAGYDHIGGRLPPQATLLNGRGIHTSATAELALTLILASQRELPSFVLAQHEGRWERPGAAPGLADRRVLVLGYGDIGQALGRRLVACEATVVGARTQAHEPDGVAAEVIALADVRGRLAEFGVVVALLPLTDETRGLVDADFLARMRPGALLVNVGRGPLVDTDALLAALRSGRVRAALDVTDPEPLPDGHPLFSAPGCLVTPHVGGHSQVMRTRIEDFLDVQLRRLAADEPLLNVVREPS